MATETSSIDDFLVSGKTQSQPEAPEHQYKENAEIDSHDDVQDLATEVQPEYEPQFYGEETEQEESEQPKEEV